MTNLLQILSVYVLDCSLAAGPTFHFYNLEICRQLQGLWFDPELGLLPLWTFMCSPLVHEGFLPTPKNILFL